MPTVCAALLSLVGLTIILGGDRGLLTHSVWRYVAALGMAALFVVSCLFSGHALVVRVLRRTLRCADHLTISFALGIGLFYLGTFALGIVGLLGTVPCVVMPVAMIGLGFRPVLRTYRRFRHLRRVFCGLGPPSPRLGWMALAIGGASLLPLGARWLTTSSAGYDSLWYHLAIAERYAVVGGIEPFREGWLQGAAPHMASVLYAWAFVLSGSTALGMVTSGLLEYAFVLSAVLGVVPLARALIKRGPRVPWAWASVSMFPAWHLYGPQLEADCLVAAFAPALALLTFAAWRSFDWRWLLLFGVVLGSAASVKHTAFTVCAFPVMAVAVRAAIGLARPAVSQSRRRVLWALASGLAAALGVTSTFWLRNWIYYQNPVYPSLISVFGGEPWSSAADTYHREVWTALLWRAPDGMGGVMPILKALFTFSFEPHEYPIYNPGRPLFGSLFTLSLPVLLVSPRALRGLVLYVGVLAGIALWLKVHSQDRYLEALLPWMMAVVAVAFAMAWRAGVLGRVFGCAAVALQLVWTIPLAVARFPHSEVNAALAAPTTSAWDTAQSAAFAGWRAIGRELSSNAVLLVHENQVRFGVGRRTVTDEVGFQGKLSYGELGNDAAIYDALRELQVTHIHASMTSRALDSLGSDLAFYAFFARQATPTSLPNLRRMPRRRPARAGSRLVFIDACGSLPELSGLYLLRDLNRFGGQQGNAARPVERLDVESDPEQASSLLERAEFLVLGSSCAKRTLSLAADRFEALATRGSLQLLLRARAVDE